MAEDPPRLRIGSFAAHSSRGLIRDRKTRRGIMLGSLVVALVLLVLAANIDAHENLWLAVACWLACTWMTVLALLVAFYDFLIVRRDARQQREELDRELGRN